MRILEQLNPIQLYHYRDEMGTMSPTSRSSKITIALVYLIIPQRQSVYTILIYMSFIIIRASRYIVYLLCIDIMLVTRYYIHLP